MSETKVTLDVSEWAAFIANTTDKMKRLAVSMYSIITTYAYQDIIDHFRKETGPEGDWADRQEPYKSYIEGKGYTKILQVTGNLRQSISFSRPDSSSIAVIANAPYSGSLDEGNKGMPARPFMWLTDRAQDKMMNAIMGFIEEGK